MAGGNKEIAKARINDIRRRAAVPGKEAEMEVLKRACSLCSVGCVSILF